MLHNVQGPMQTISYSLHHHGRLFDVCWSVSISKVKLWICLAIQRSVLWRDVGQVWTDRQRQCIMLPR